ncbi:MAG: PAS domain-containing protein [Proteobacteria bacterium]|nr:PAS domain-containing protein [Pseudomonadota bacterium]
MSIPPTVAALLGAGVSALGVGLFLRRRLLREAREAASLRDQLSRERSSRAESQAAENARQEALFENMLEGVLLVDATGRLQFTNTACRRFFDLEADVRGRTLLEAFRCNDLSAVAAEAAKAGRVNGKELELEGGMEARLLQVNAVALVGPEGRPDGVLMVLHDATRLRQLESTRREFVANVSHELRTPLSLIKGSVETLLDGAASQPAIASKFLDIIDRHCDRLTFLIEDLLTLSRLESGQLAINYDTVPLRDHVSEVFDDFHRKAEDRGVKLFNDVPDGLHARADSDRLDQVLSNLIDNAIKYGRPGGTVRIEGREVPGGDLIEMAVASILRISERGRVTTSLAVWRVTPLASWDLIMPVSTRSSFVSTVEARYSLGMTEFGKRMFCSR